MRRSFSFFTLMFLFVVCFSFSAFADGVDDADEKETPRHPHTEVAQPSPQMIPSDVTLRVVQERGPDAADMPPLHLGPLRTADVRPYPSCPDDTHCGQLYGVLRAAIHAGGEVGAAAVWEPDEFNISAGASASGGNLTAINRSSSGAIASSDSKSFAEGGEGGDGGNATVGDINVSQEQGQHQHQDQDQHQKQDQDQEQTNNPMPMMGGGGRD